MHLFSGRNRPAHLGTFPLERLPRSSARQIIASRPRRPDAAAPPSSMLGGVIEDYFACYQPFVDGDVAKAKAPIGQLSQDPTHDLKAACYFLDASMVGICASQEGLWFESQSDGSAINPAKYDHLAVVLVETGRVPEADNLAAEWIEGDNGRAAALRAAEIAIVAAGYIRNLGWQARAHCLRYSDVDLESAAIMAGLAERRRGTLTAPFIGSDFALAAVSTDYPLENDFPLAEGAVDRARDMPAGGLASAARISGRERQAASRRPSHLGRYPMETVSRVESTTTLILEDEVPRVPKRAAFFERALKGDLGPKAKRERSRFATKHPLSLAMTPLIGCLCPRQDGILAKEVQHDNVEAGRLADAVRSLAYYLGADLAGVTAAKPYAWFSHDEAGDPIPVRHDWAVVLLIDQGYETMEGSSGDDWISGAQSMRSYLRGAEMAGVMAELFRRLGYSSRSQTNRDSDVLHIPLILEAGLGELSRIGELVLNPFVGPRFKSVVVTTDLPLVQDKPIDFGLQDMCNKCMKCARECPCDAIPLGNKIMFNGYEMWKPDVHRCASYRVTNAKGSACGRCMKTCPYNHEGLLWFKPFLWMAIHWPFTRRTFAKFDDWMERGRLNPVKKWWFDLEWVNGTSVLAKGANVQATRQGQGPRPGQTVHGLFPCIRHAIAGCAGTGAGRPQGGGRHGIAVRNPR